MVGKEHKGLLRDIRKYCEQLGESKIALTDFFSESAYTTAQNKTMPCYLVTKKGCEFIAHKLTGQKGTEFTARYINRFHEMEDTISTPQLPPLTLQQQIQTIAKGTDELYSRVDAAESRIAKLEDTMNLDYGQQRILGEVVARTVMEALGGDSLPAYKGIGRKVFAECNHDLKAYFKVNARANVPKKRFDEAVEYARNWKPCTNTAMLIAEYNAQQTLNLEGGASRC